MYLVTWHPSIGSLLTRTVVVSLTGRSSSPYTRTIPCGAPSHVPMSAALGTVADTATKRTDVTGICRIGEKLWRLE